MLGDGALHPYGVIQAVQQGGELPRERKVDVRHARKSGGAARATRCHFHNREREVKFFGIYGFELRDVMPLPFRPYRGALGFFEVSDA